MLSAKVVRLIIKFKKLTKNKQINKHTKQSQKKQTNLLIYMVIMYADFINMVRNLESENCTKSY